MSKAPKNTMLQARTNVAQITPPAGFRRITDKDGKVWFKAADAKNPDAKLLALGEELRAALAAEYAAEKAERRAARPWERIWKRLDAECTAKYGKHSDKWSRGANMDIADKTAAGRAYAAPRKAFLRAADRTFGLCTRIRRIQPRTIEGLAILALAVARNGWVGGGVGFDITSDVARLAIATCAVAKFSIPPSMRARLTAYARH